MVIDILTIPLVCGMCGQPGGEEEIQTGKHLFFKDQPVVRLPIEILLAKPVLKFLTRLKFLIRTTSISEIFTDFRLNYFQSFGFPSLKKMSQIESKIQ